MSLLRPSEHFRLQLDAETVSEDRGKRTLAVVSHIGEFGQHEEGSLFILQKHGSEPDGWNIERVVPISGNFSISVAQMRRETLDLTVTSSALRQPRSGLRINISSGNEFISLFTHDVQGLKNLLPECKRLKVLSDNSLTASPQTYSWLVPYVSRDAVLFNLSGSPTDLRLANLPLHARLSLVQPGLSDTDTEDLLMIREEWLKHRVRETGSRGRRQLRLRIGTFNVNGNLPSQDLSPWMQGRGQRVKIPVHDHEHFAHFDDLQASVALSDKLERELSVSESSTCPIPTTSSFSATTLDSCFTLTADTKSTSSPYPHATYTTMAGPVDSELPDDPDLIVCGFQELDLSAEALLYSTNTIREDAWVRALFAGLGEKASHYTKLVSKQLVGMLLVVIVKISLESCFTDIQLTAAGAGIMGIMGNKGGTAVRLTFKPPAYDITSPGPTVLTFVNAHLAAFDEMLDRRNADFHDLSRRLSFDAPSVAEDNIANLPQQNKLTIYESDVLFWMGDLNYRINLPDQDVRQILQSTWDNKFQLLYEYDQLRISRAKKMAFNLFLEAPINRPPTYRFSPGLLRDDLGYDLKRRPAWTDRILYICSPATTTVQQLTYSAHPEVTMSDHRPVSADFLVHVNLYDEQHCKETARKLSHKLEGMENSFERPSIKLDSIDVDFGSIVYKVPVIRKLTIRNDGKIPCAFRFMPMEGENSAHPHWLHIEPMTSLMLPKESLDLTLTAFVDNDIAANLNLLPRLLDHTLILHTLMGRDHFIAVTGQFEYTCFANSIQRLTRLHGSIRSMRSCEDLLPEERSMNAPREVTRLVNWLMTTNSTEGVFEERVDQTLVGIVRECLDTGTEFPFADGSNEDSKLVAAVGETLIQLLDSLVEPVVPVSAHARCVQATSRDEAFELLDEFPPAAVNVWIQVTAFLHYISRSAPDPPGKAKKLAALFAPVLLRADPATTSFPDSPLGKADFLLNFIV